MEVKCYRVGAIGTNCYFVGDEATHCGCIIDPGDNAEQLIAAWNNFGYSMESILLTHGHYDHTTALPKVAAAFPNAPVYVHKADVCESGDPQFYQCRSVPNMQYIAEGDIIPVGSITITVMVTPGHTPGSVVFRTTDALFTGDTLFAGSCGRVDFPGGDWGTMCKSLQRLAALPGNYKIYPGHEWSSDLDTERASNSFMRSAMESGQA